MQRRERKLVRKEICKALKIRIQVGSLLWKRREKVNKLKKYQLKKLSQVEEEENQGEGELLSRR